jgi:hypothetical protein
MNTLTVFSKFSFGKNREFIVIGDDYHNIKFCKYPEIYHITNIFSPYKDKAFSKFLDLAPNGIVALFNDGSVEIISLNSLETNEYQSKKLDIASKIDDKKIYDVAKVDDTHFIAVDDYYTVVVVIGLKDGEIVSEKIVSIADKKILGDVKDFYSSRFVEAYKQGNSLEVFFKYENKEGSIENGGAELFKLNETVFVKRISIEF